MQNIYYFAYGSNINSENMHKTCPGAKSLGTTFLLDYKLAFMGNKGAAIACVESAKGEKVPVVVWELDLGDVKKLTNYVTLPYLYKRGQKQVKLGDKMLDGIMYFPTLNLKHCLPSEGYLNTLRGGYVEHGLNTEAIDKAILEINKQ